MVRPLITLVAVLMAAASLARAEQPCCGPITPAGAALARTLDGMAVDRHWLAGGSLHIDWRTGDPDPNHPYTRFTGGHTHCSAFAAAAAERLGAYLLRPPEHGQDLLANAQGAWLADGRGAGKGWHQVSAREAQMEANRGHLVVVVFINPDPSKPGHSAIVRPSLKDEALLAADGPEIIMAGTVNRPDTSARIGFHGHPGAFPNGMRYYAHALKP